MYQASQFATQRKRLAKVVRMLDDLTKEYATLADQLKCIEGDCRHLWSKRKYVKATDSFLRDCSRCGMVTDKKD